MGIKRITIDRLVELSDQHAGLGDVLDVGCGEKVYSLFVKCDSYTGIEVENSGRKQEEKKADKYFDGINIPFPDETFDFVLCTEVLEHAIEPVSLLIEMKRVLKTNGLLLITVPSMWGEHETPYDFRRYTSFGIKRIIEKQKLEITDYQKEAVGVEALIRLGLSEVTASKNNAVSKWAAKFWLKLTFGVFQFLLRIEMPRIFLTNVVTAQKK